MMIIITIIIIMIIIIKTIIKFYIKFQQDIVLMLDSVQAACPTGPVIPGRGEHCINFVHEMRRINTNAD